MAVIHPEISKPFMIPAEIRKIMAFTTNVKSPRVMILIGKVSSRRIGLRNILKKPTMIAAISALGNEVILKPGTIIAVR